jgi:uncharacterized caspase-like protein
LALVPAPALAQARDITVEAMRSEKRVALVIGNAAYAVGRLNNPVLDARAMAQVLRGLGFEVLAREDVDHQKLRRAIADFGERIAGGGVGLFYYSGHGLQVNGRNYLVPVDAELKSERYVGAEAVDVDSVLAQMHEAKTRVNIVILDACRNNPFAQRFRSPHMGLAFMDAPAGTYMAYSTAPGSVADDGEPGKNGTYTAELLRTLQEPGLKIEDVFKRVRVRVQQRTSQRQNPWDASSLTGEFFFELSTASAAPVPGPASPPSITAEIERQYGTLAIRARVAGIEVWLDEQKVGETQTGGDLVLRNVAVGPHRVKGRKAGQKDWERGVDVAVNQRAEVLIDIEPVRPETTPPPRTEDGGHAPRATAPGGDAPAPGRGPVPVPPAAAAPPASEPDFAYFHDQLAPFGTWVEVGGVPYWRPDSALRANPEWRPYYDMGQWIQTDNGLFWQSDYTWGDIPFHYGRWVRDPGMGWVWAPDYTWGPAWVFWRHAEADGAIGWAPLPVGAVFVDGVFMFNGVPVGAEFDFGLSAGVFTFVGHDHFHERFFRLRGREYAWHVHGDRFHEFYRRSVLRNEFRRDAHGRFVNEGIGRARLEHATQGRVTHTRFEERRPVGDRAALAHSPNRPGATHSVASSTGPSKVFRPPIAAAPKPAAAPRPAAAAPSKRGK